jgi:hypothetical protein
MRFVESLALRPEDTLAANGIPARFPLLAAVVTAVDEDGNDIHVPSNQGIQNYKVVAAIDSDNNYLSLGNNRSSD